MLANTPAPSIIGNRYLLFDMIGEGSMGAVYRVMDRLHGTYVALKKVSRNAGDLNFAASSSMLDRESFELALANEFQILARLRHPHIVSVLDFGFDVDKRPYFTMDLLPNAQRIHDAALQKSPVDRVHLLLQLLEALAYFHQRGVIHRDLKPENVLVDERGQLRVLDFGLALSAQAAQRTEEPLYGTLAYMAPEVLQGKRAQIQSDLYGFGLIAYHVFGGSYPFDLADTRNLINNILHHVPDVTRFDTPIGRFLERLLTKDPEDRYRNVDEVIGALCRATGFPRPRESLAIRESYLQTASFVGREAEMRTLVDLIDSIQNNKGAICLVGGESGVGKSRFLNEIRVHALIQNIPVLQGQAIAEGGAPYHVWRRVLQWLPIVTNLTELEAQVIKDFLPSSSETFQEVQSAPELSGPAAQDRLINVIADILRRHPTPMIVLLEDLHWAGAESLRLLKELVRVVRDSHVLIVGSYRYDETPYLADEVPGAVLLKLERFNRQEIAALTHSILGRAELKPEIVDFLERETSGNGFFVVETLRTMAAETGELRKISATAVKTPIVAGGVMAVLQQRLSRLTDESLTVLRFAAIIGRELNLALLNHLAPETDLQKWLVFCTDAAVLEARENRWYFAHDKLREFLLARLRQEENTLRDLHHRVAVAIEAVFTGQDSYVPALAHHWTQARNAVKATYYLEKAALFAIVGAPATVIDYIKQAMEFDSEGENVHAMRQARRHSLLGNAYYAMGNYKLAEVHLEAASRYLGATVTPRQTWQVGLGILRQVGLQFLHQKAPSRYLAKRDSAQFDRSMYAALFNKQVVYSYQGEMLKILHAGLVALNTIENLKPSEVATPVMAYAALTLSTGLMGLHSIAGYYLKLTNAALPQAGTHPQVLSRALIGMYGLQRANWTESIETIENVVQRFDQIGAFHSADESACYLSRAYAHTVGFDRALALALRSYERAKQRNDKIVRFQLYVLVVLLLTRQNRLSSNDFDDIVLLTQASDAETLFSEAFEANALNRGFYHAVRALVHLATGDTAEAFLSLRESAQGALSRGIERSVLYFELYAAIAEVGLSFMNSAVLAQVEQAEATALFQQSVQQLAKYGKVFTFAQPRVRLYQGWERKLKGQPLQAYKLWRQALSSAEALHMPYEAGLAHTVLAQAGDLSDEERQDHLQAAMRLFDQMDAGDAPAKSRSD